MFDIGRKSFWKLHECLASLQGYVCALAACIRHKFLSDSSVVPCSEFQNTLYADRDVFPDFANGALTDKLVQSAKTILLHKLDIFDEKQIDVSMKEKRGVNLCKSTKQSKNDFYRPIDWHCDLGSNYRWNKYGMPYWMLRRLPPSLGVDIKWPWELSRCQHLPVLAVVSHLDPGESKVSSNQCWNEFENQVADWVSNNPLGLGVNWVCDMDVSIRVVNWIVAFFLFKKDVDLGGQWQRQFWRSVYEHASFLYKHLRKPKGRKGNHYIAELAGLYIIGSLCPFFPESSVWRELAGEELESQIRLQIQPDGTHLEGSTAYHVLVAEMFLYAGIIADCLNTPFSKYYRSRMKNMLEVVNHISSSLYVLPQIGDSDGGYFLKPVVMDEAHTRTGHLLELGICYVASQCNWTVKEALARILIINKHNVPCEHRLLQPYKAKVFKDSGWVVLVKGSVKVIICSGSSGTRALSGHSHEDILSFSLFWDGYPIIVDPGTYVYTPYPRMRNRFRSAIGHNQPQFEAAEEMWLNHKVFRHIPMPEVHWKLTSAKEQPNGFCARADHELENVRYNTSRKIVLNYQKVGVLDSIDSDTPSNVRIGVCLHPDIKCSRIDKNRFELRTQNIELIFESNSSLFIAEQAKYSKGYGHICDTTWLIFKRKSRACSVSWAITSANRVEAPSYCEIL